MKKLILLGLILLSVMLSNCEHVPSKVYETNSFQLRQLVNKETVSTKSESSFFLISGSYISETQREETLKVFAKVGDSYRFIEISLEDIRIVINDDLNKPEIQFVYEGYGVHGDKRSSDNTAIEDYRNKYSSHVKAVTIYCPEKYLPEKLLPIELN